MGCRLSVFLPINGAFRFPNFGRFFGPNLGVKCFRVQRLFFFPVSRVLTFTSTVPVTRGFISESNSLIPTTLSLSNTISSRCTAPAMASYRDQLARDDISVRFSQKRTRATVRSCDVLARSPKPLTLTPRMRLFNFSGAVT